LPKTINSNKRLINENQILKKVNIDLNEIDRKYQIQSLKLDSALACIVKYELKLEQYKNLVQNPDSHAYKTVKENLVFLNADGSKKFQSGILVNHTLLITWYNRPNELLIFRVCTDNSKDFYGVGFKIDGNREMGSVLTEWWGELTISDCNIIFSQTYPLFKASHEPPKVIINLCTFTDGGWTVLYKAEDTERKGKVRFINVD
jgi:hypothetical protein